LPVIVFSAHTSRGAAATLDALLLGANDCVPKARAKDADTAVEQVRKELIPRIKALCGDGAGAAETPRATVTPLRPAGAIVRAGARPARIDIVAIGASTGGPRAVTEIAAALPAGLPVPVLVVQHMPPVFTSYFAERLGARTGMRVAEATAGVEPGPGELWIAPGDQHLVVAREGLTVRLELSTGAKEHSCRPAVDPLFRSVADVYGAHALAVVLTGMGQDGLDGAARIAAAGGQVLVQDEGSSVVWGMPGSVARAGHADAIVPLERMASEIVLRVGAGRSARGNAA
jgi:two-component system chemotaxis response regulator CheB